MLRSEFHWRRLPRTVCEELKINLFVVVRLVIGLLFIVSGWEKLISPYQNFLYVVQGYQIFPALLEEGIARLFPWLELILGVFIALGLWLKESLRVLWVVVGGFIFLLTQALLRKLPLEECGCFGELIAFPLPVTLVLDSILLVIVSILISGLEKTSHVSFDRRFS